MKKITTHIWFDTEAKEAAEFYTTVFEGAKITSKNVIHDTPSGTVDILNLEIFKHEFTFISAGPYFKPNPSVSFLIACETASEVDGLWKKLAVGGKAMMELAEYPFSKRYGWIQDKYGVSWQVMLMGERTITQKITPTLMFVGKQCGKTEEAVNMYTSVFHNAKVGSIMRYNEGEEPDKAGTIRHVGFTLEGQEFAAMDSAHKHEFSFTEGISFVVHCETQQEIDYFWEKLSADPAAEQCGWLKDAYGFSWQIVPNAMDKMMGSGDQTKIARITQAFLKMKKFDIAELERVYKGE